ncbi:LuxR C-terminal-related transcriptional regulator [Aliidiomarina shirensis]|nr:LuxR C-terminal-related transcriptional regulator [Aliidiomarina shirensis]
MSDLNSVLIIEERTDSLSLVEDVFKTHIGKITPIKLPMAPQSVSTAIASEPELIVLEASKRGYAALAKLRKSCVPSRIIMFSASDAETDILNAIRNGADGYLLKDTDPAQLSALLTKALQGKMALSEGVVEILAKALRYSESEIQQASQQPLTKREKEILRLLTEGKSNRILAEELAISEGTVKVHIKNILKKLGLRSRMQAALWQLKR